MIYRFSTTMAFKYANEEYQYFEELAILIGIGDSEEQEE